VEFHWGRHKLY